MDLETYLVDDVVKATTPPNETAAAARNRREAIIEMVQAYGPTDRKEGMIVCHCIMLQFTLIGAMRDANNTDLEPAVLARARSSAISMSRTLHQWVTKFEAIHKRSEARDPAAQKNATPRPGTQRPPNALPMTDPPVLHAPVPDGWPAHPGNAPPAPANGSTAVPPGQSPSPAAAERRPPT
jgi:hypothetical protein